jgi:hypothetical protein
MIDGELSAIDVHYICDVLGLSSASFESEHVRDLIEELSNPEIQSSPLKRADIERIRAQLEASIES